jgi:hypothetical protein
MRGKMSDLISRKKAIEVISELPVKVDNLGYTWMIAGDVLKQIDEIPSAESERMAKVIEHDASITDTDGYKYHRSEYLCSACKKKVLGGDEYCSHCGTKLDWSGNERN